MLGMKLPTISEEDRKSQWDNLKVNDELISFNTGGWDSDYYIKIHKVIKKTPTGSIRLDNGELLKTFYSKYYIFTDELGECIKKIRLQDDVTHLLFEVDRAKRKFKENMSYEDALRLKETLSKIINRFNIGD